MPFIPIPNTVLARIKLVIGAAISFEASIDLWFFKDDFTEADMTSLADALEAGFIVALMDPLPASAVCTHMTLYDMNSIDGYKIERVESVAGGKIGSDTPVAVGNALVVSFYGNKRGKWNQGRNFVPGIDETDSAYSGVNESVKNTLVAAYGTMITTPPAGWTWVVASRYLNKAPRPAGVTTPIVSVLARNTSWGYQKRRQRRG